MGRTVSLALLWFAWVVPCAALAEAPPLVNAGTGGYLRFVEADGRPQALQVSITRLSRPDGVSVDLVSAVHVGDADYYAGLNRRLSRYDVVLYELVADPGVDGGKPAPGQRREDPALRAVSNLQDGMTRVLELAHQLDAIDYGAGNFVHADLTPDQFADSMAQRGESLFKTFLDTWFAAMTQPGMVRPVSDVDLFKALFAEDRARALKVILARQFASIDGVMAAMSGGEEGSTLISVRNERALAVLRDQLEAGHRNVAIFYGAGHMPDFESRLATDFGLVPVSREWVDAWNLRKG